MAKVAQKYGHLTSTYANVTIPNGGSVISGTGLNYSTATTAVWSTPGKVKITDQDIELDGLSLKETMKSIKDELLIPTRLNRNERLEQEYAELKAKAEEYYALEKHFLEQKKMWTTLKTTDQ